MHTPKIKVVVSLLVAFDYRAAEDPAARTHGALVVQYLALANHNLIAIWPNVNPVIPRIGNDN
jgi:hypothetical protein